MNTYSLLLDHHRESFASGNTRSGPADIGKIVNIVIGALVIATIPVVFEYTP
jgi:hypothetical protein